MASASALTDSADVVVARIVPFVAAPPSRRSSAGLASCSSAMASTTNVASSRESRSSETDTLPAPSAAALLDQALDLRGRGVRPARPEHDLAVLGGDAGEAGGDGASSGDADPF